MKLRDLEPEFYGAAGGRSGVGIIFNCPCGDSDRMHRCAIPFANPIDGKGPCGDGRGWQRTGETFDDLTLTPSILRMEGCKWHGFITNGEVRTV